MSDEPVEIVRGSGNVFRDFGYPDADVRQAKARMGARIIRILDEEGLSTRQAEAKTGVAHSEFSRIRRASFTRFTIDRLIGILHRLDRDVEVTLDIRARPRAPAVIPTAPVQGVSALS